MNRFYKLALALCVLVSTPALGIGRFHVIKHVLAPSTASGIVYDTSVGASVDTNGFTSLPLRGGAHTFYVNTSGSDANSCAAAQNPATPKATSISAIGCVTSGAGDHVLLAEGQTFTGEFYNDYLSSKPGFSALYPTVISSYDPADPTNVSKIGMGQDRSGRPLITFDIKTGITGGLMGGGPFCCLAIKGLAFDPGNTEAEGLSFVGDSTNNTGGPSYLLIENNLFHHAQFSVDAATALGHAFMSSHVIFRNNDFDGAFQKTTGGSCARVGGIYTGGGITGVTIEDNVFYHTGWKEGDPDRLSIPCSGTQSHPAYIQTDTVSDIYRRNLVIEPSADGGIMRGSGIMTENVLIHVPAGLGVGPDSSHWNDNANGVDIDVGYNLNIASISNGDFAGPQGYAFSSSKGNPGTRIHHNLIVQSENSINTPSVFSNTSQGAVYKSYMEHEDNLSFAWASAGHTIFTDAGANSANSLPYTTYDFNSWEDGTSGSNTSNSGATFPTAYMLSTLLTAAGYANLSTLESYAIGHPEAHVQRTLRALAFTGYGRNAAAVDTTAPTLSAPTATSPSSGNATLGVTTDDGTGKLYYELLTTGTAPHVSRIKVGVDSSDVAAPKAGSVVITSSGTKSISVTSVPPGTYFAHFMHEDAEANKSLAVTSASFTVGGASTLWATNAGDYTLSNGSLTANRSGTGTFWGYELTTVPKTNGTFVVTINAMGSASNDYIGFNDGTESGAPGSNHSIFWRQDGALMYALSNIATLASWTTGDKLEMVKAAGTITFYKWNGSSYVQQGSPIDTTSVAYGLGSVLAGNAYPSIASFNNTGFQVTADFSAF